MEPLSSAKQLATPLATPLGHLAFDLCSAYSSGYTSTTTEANITTHLPGVNYLGCVACTAGVRTTHLAQRKLAMGTRRVHHLHRQPCHSWLDILARARQQRPNSLSTLLADQPSMHRHRVRRIVHQLTFTACTGNRCMPMQSTQSHSAAPWCLRCPCTAPTPRGRAPWLVRCWSATSPWTHSRQGGCDTGFVTCPTKLR